MNRGNIPGHIRSIEQGMGGGNRSFYGPVRRGLVAGRLAELKRTGRLAARMRQIDTALGGSDLIERVARAIRIITRAVSGKTSTANGSTIGAWPAQESIA